MCGGLFSSPKIPDPPPPVKPPAPVAPEKLPQADVYRDRNRNQMRPGGVMAGNSSTLLTDPMADGGLTLGKSTLLG